MNDFRNTLLEEVAAMLDAAGGSMDGQLGAAERKIATRIRNLKIPSPVFMKTVRVEISSNDTLYFHTDGTRWPMMKASSFPIPLHDGDELEVSARVTKRVKP